MIQACIYLKPRPSLPSPSPILTPCVLRSVTQPCPTLCHPLDCSPTDSSVHGIFNGNPFQYSCLENAIDRGARQATVHGIQRVGQDCAANFQFSLLFHYHKSSRETPPPTPGLSKITYNSFITNAWSLRRTPCLHIFPLAHSPPFVTP